MNTSISSILEMLENDIVSYGHLLQAVKSNLKDFGSYDQGIQFVLEELLRPGNVEIGNTVLADRNYVEFIAWKGTVPERIARANETIRNAKVADREFAYWLCFRQNVDRYEGEELGSEPV